MKRDPLARHNVRVLGDASAPRTLVFVHGIGSDQSVWEAVARPFLADCRVVLMDNAGAVPANQDEFRTQRTRYLNASGYALDLLEVCDALGLAGEVVAVGHSLGGLAALLAAGQRPGLFARLVLLGVSPRYLEAPGYAGGFTEQDLAMTYEALTRDYGGWADNLAQGVLGAAGEPGLVQGFAQSVRSVPPQLMLTVLCSVLQGDHREALRQVRCPTLLLQSRHDIFVPLAVAEFLRERLPDARLQIIETSGHLPHLTAPGPVAQAIRDFL